MATLSTLTGDGNAGSGTRDWVMLWKLYYQDTTYSSDDGLWGGAPPRGVQALATPHPTSNREIQTGDFYFWPPWCESPISGDLFGVVDYLIEIGIDTDDDMWLRPVIERQHGIKWGRSLDSGTYNSLFQRIVEDADLISWGPKTTRAPYER